MNLLDKKRLSRDLSGPAASVLIALILAGGSVTASELADDWTNLSRPIVTTGLKRLVERGIVTYHGHFNGYQVNLNQLRLWQGHDGIFLSEKVTNQSGSFVASPQTESSPCPPVDNSAETPPDYENCKIFTILPSDQIRSDLAFKSDFDFLKSDQIRHLIEFFTIQPPNSDRLLETNADPATLYGWLLWAHCQEWIKKPLSWSLKVTLNPQKPLEKNWYEVAAWLLSLDDETRREIEYQQNGRSNQPVEIRASVYAGGGGEIDHDLAELIALVIKARQSAALWRIV